MDINSQTSLLSPQCADKVSNETDLSRRITKTHLNHATNDSGKSHDGEGILSGCTDNASNLTPGYEDSVFCHTCGKEFPTESRLDAHLQFYPEIHFCCLICGEVFLYEGPLKNHLRSHDGNYMYECALCMQTFVDRDELFTHIGEVHPA